ncbi:MAG: hypothetical protein K0R39_4955 [Symbiobacteriaceae bacterium]|jgi:hypothetical protein|nr:hypothetical protein [Symbiobacteriaceae bacterium]
MAGEVVIAANEALFQMAVDKYYELNPTSFSRTELFELPFIGPVEVMLHVPAAPRIDLRPIAGSMAHFMASTDRLQVQVCVTPAGGQKLKMAEVTYKAGLSGNLALNGSKVQARNLAVTLNGPLDQAVEPAVNNYLAGPVREIFQAVLPLAQLGAILGPTVTVAPLSLTTAGNMALLRLRLGSDTAGSPQLPAPGAGGPAICSAMDRDAVNTVLQGAFRNLEYTAQAQGAIPLVGTWSMRGGITAENLQLTAIGGPDALGTIDLRASLALSLDLAGPLPAAAHDLSLTGRVPFTVQVETDSEGKRVLVRPLLGAPQISLPTTLPAPFQQVLEIAGRHVSNMAEALVQQINQHFGQYVPQLTVYQIPDVLPGLPVPVSLSFDTLGFEGDRLVAILTASV